jgi:hypothetical protein
VRRDPARKIGRNVFNHASLDSPEFLDGDEAIRSTNYGGGDRVKYARERCMPGIDSSGSKPRGK